MDVCTFYRFDGDTDELIIAATRGLDEAICGYRLPTDRGLTGWVARKRRPLAAKRPALHPEFHHVPGSGEEKYRSYLGIPLLDLGRLVGVLVIQTVEPRMFDMSEIDDLLATGRHLVRSIRAGRTAGPRQDARQPGAA